MLQSEDRIIAFIDILGFKELVENAEKNNDYNKLSSLINESTKLFDDLKSSSEFQFTQISDSFVLSCKSFDINDSMVFMIHLQELIDIFLKEGILLRGGVTVGKIVHTKKLLMGTGFNKAYQLENKEAIYPRVIIDRELLDYWETCLYDHNIENILEVSKDYDGFYYMDYIERRNLPPKLNVILDKAYELIDSNVRSLNEKGLWLMKKLKPYLKSNI